MTALAHPNTRGSGLVPAPAVWRDQLRAGAGGRAASHAERLLVGLLRAARITGWKLNYQVQGYLIDLAFPAQRVAIEVDGWAWHVTADRFVDDRRRQNAVVNLQWTVLRFLPK